MTSPILITCPAHPGKHFATLEVAGKHRGIWECPITGESDTHDHEKYALDAREPVFEPFVYEDGKSTAPTLERLRICAVDGVKIDI